MAENRTELTNPGRRLPDLRLPPAEGGAEVGIRAPGRRAPVLVLLHGAGCPDCRQFVRSLAAGRAAIEEWDGRVVVVVPEAPAAETGVAEEPGAPFPVLVDGTQRLVARLSIQPPATVIADQWGEIHSAVEAGPEHRFPTPAEVVEWVRYLAVQCPECQGEAL